MIAHNGVGAKVLLKMTPAQERRKAREVGIRRNPFAAALNGEGGMRRVRDDLALQISLLAKLPENVPMAGTGSDHGAGRAARECVDELESLCAGRRRLEDPPIRDDANEAVEGELRNREGL